MDILAKLDEIDAFTEFITERSDLIRKEISKQGIAKKRIHKEQLDLLARAKAKRAKSRFS